MSGPEIATNIGGGNPIGIFGAASVSGAIFNIYGFSPPTPAAETALVTDAIGDCPFPGLFYFGPADKDRFFGRDAAIGNLVATVGRHSLTAFVGASGSGKSSVVLAGLAPHLHDAGGWLFSYFRIGNVATRSWPWLLPWCRFTSPARMQPTGLSRPGSSRMRSDPAN